MRTAGLGYLWTSLILFAGVLMVLGIWYFALGLGECESHHPSQSGSLLLAGDSHLQYAWHRAWRLFSRYIRAWLRRRRSCLWRHAGPDRGAIFLHEHPAGMLVNAFQSHIRMSGNCTLARWRMHHVKLRETVLSFQRIPLQASAAEGLRKPSRGGKRQRECRGLLSFTANFSFLAKAALL